MGRRTRKRSAPPPEERRAAPLGAPAERRAPVGPASRRARLGEAPKPPWAPFPLVELLILLGIVLLVFGFVHRGSRSGLFVACGLVLVGVASLEVAIREHFGGFRSHSSLLALAAAVAVIVLVAFAAHAGGAVLAGVGAVVFGLSFAGLRSAFRRRTGGMGFRA